MIPAADRAALDAARKLSSVREDMQFRLTYDGPLKTGTSKWTVEAKHQIRKQLHAQLEDLCGRNVALMALAGSIRGLYARERATYGAISDTALMMYDAYNLDLSSVGQRFKFDDFEFVPLVVGELHTVCELDILFLRRERPGALISRRSGEYGGDLDNRLKTFFDALRAPTSMAELPRGAKPEAAEEPFYCLLEDDALITKFQVESDTLLASPQLPDPEHVRLVVRVTIRPTKSTLHNTQFSI